MLILRAIGPAVSLIIAGAIVAYAAGADLGDMLIHIAQQFAVLRAIF